MRPALILLLASCAGTDNHTPSPPEIDLVSLVPSGEVRAGVITDPASAFGGLSAEARLGDIKLYNDRARFVIQGIRDGGYFISQGGGVIDADVAGDLLGHDHIDEWGSMWGLGRVVEPTRIEVLDDGSGGTAHVRVEGIEAPLALLEGALESPGFVRSLGLRLTIDYRLRPDSPLLEVTSTFTSDQEVELASGDLLMGGVEVSRAWSEGYGWGDDDGGPRLWTGQVGESGQVTTAILSADGTPLEVGTLQLLTELADMVVGFDAERLVPAGETVSWTRYWGVGTDLATLTDAAQATWPQPTETHTGVVTAPDGPVEGAEVVVLVDDAPFTVARTDASGAFSAEVPEGADVRSLAQDRGTGRFLSLPALDYSPYAAEVVRDAMLQAFSTADPITSGGRGIADPSTPHTLGEPAVLSLSASDGLPFAVELSLRQADAPIDNRISRDRPSGLAAMGWARGGSVEIRVEPGTYGLLAHRGLRYELHSQEITLQAGETTELQLELDRAYEHPGWVLGDPHAHASPSGDAAITMADRLVVTAAVGLDLHFGTDHDHVADYRPLLAALGLSELGSVVADEVSPPLRGHMNIYPIDPADLPNGGAWRWWEDIPEDTPSIIAELRERHGDDFILQSNHPLDSGVGSSAGWEPGIIRHPDYWTGDLQAMEVINAGRFEGLDIWQDLMLRGYHTAPVGVSDSHGHKAGHVGFSATFIAVGTDDVTQVSDAALAEALRAGHTMVCRGPFLDVSVLPGETLLAGTTVDVAALSPSWMSVDRLVLLRDGAEVQRVDGTSASFVLDTSEDALFTVVAEGDQPMLPVDGNTPWSMVYWLVDAGGDGWEPPLPPLLTP